MDTTSRVGSDIPSNDTNHELARFQARGVSLVRAADKDVVTHGYSTTCLISSSATATPRDTACHPYVRIAHPRWRSSYRYQSTW